MDGWMDGWLGTLYWLGTASGHPIGLLQELCNINSESGMSHDTVHSVSCELIL